MGWKLAQSPKVDKIYYAPGNGGTQNNVDISSDDIEGLAKFAKENNCVTVVGPEVPLSMGIVDEFVKKGAPVAFDLMERDTKNGHFAMGMVKDPNGIWIGFRSMSPK